MLMAKEVLKLAVMLLARKSHPKCKQTSANKCLYSTTYVRESGGLISVAVTVSPQ